MADIISQELCVPLDTQSLVRIKNTPPLARLDTPQERTRSLRGAFAVTCSLAEERILLIDDVVTSGSTLSEAARTLRKAGCAQIAGMVFAKA